MAMNTLVCPYCGKRVWPHKPACPSCMHVYKLNFYKAQKRSTIALVCAVMAIMFIPLSSPFVRTIDTIFRIRLSPGLILITAFLITIVAMFYGIISLTSRSLKQGIMVKAIVAVILSAFALLVYAAAFIVWLVGLAGHVK